MTTEEEGYMCEEEYKYLYPSNDYLKEMYASHNFEKYKRVPTLTGYKAGAKHVHNFFFSNTVTLKIIGVILIIFFLVLFASFISALFKLYRSSYKSRLFRYRIIWMILSIFFVVMIIYTLDL